MTSEEAKHPQDNWTFGDWMESRVVILNDLKELESQRCEMCRYQRKDDSCARLEKADYDDAYFRGPRNYHDCDDMGRTCGAWARREP